MRYIVLKSNVFFTLFFALWVWPIQLSVMSRLARRAASHVYGNTMHILSRVVIILLRYVWYHTSHESYEGIRGSTRYTVFSCEYAYIQPSKLFHSLLHILAKHFWINWHSHEWGISLWTLHVDIYITIQVIFLVEVTWHE